MLYHKTQQDTCLLCFTHLHKEFCRGYNSFVLKQLKSAHFSWNFNLIFKMMKLFFLNVALNRLRINPFQQLDCALNVSLEHLHQVFRLEIIHCCLSRETWTVSDGYTLTKMHMLPKIGKWLQRMRCIPGYCDALLSFSKKMRGNNFSWGLFAVWDSYTWCAIMPRFLPFLPVEQS